MAENFEDRLARESKFTFDRTKGRFVHKATGKAVLQADVKSSMFRMLKGLRVDTQNMTRSFVEGNLTMVEWTKRMREMIKDAHGAFGAIAGGGVNAMGQRQWDVVSRETLRQLKFFENMVRQVLSGRQPLNGALRMRAGMYAQAAYVTYENSRRDFVQNEFEFKEEKRILAAVEHCPDCVDFAARGWRPIGTLPRIGDSVCIVNCHCHFEYR